MIYLDVINLKKRFFVVLFILFVFTLSVASAELSVHFIDVGQGDSILVCCDGETMLVDAGNLEAGKTVGKYLDRNQISGLDYVVLTHIHDDHAIGAPDALNGRSVGTLFYSRTIPFSWIMENVYPVLASGDLNTIHPGKGDQVLVGNAKVTFLTEDDTSLSINDRSLVLRIDYGETSFLLMADAESELENQLLRSGLPLKADVLKLGHHGANTSTGIDFLKAVQPEYAVISVGAKNDHSHPSKVTLNLLIKNGISKILRTDENSNIIFTSDGSRLTVKTDRNGN